MYIKGISGYLSKYEGTEVDAAVERTQRLDEEFALKVDKTTTVNDQPLSGDVVITADDIGALSNTTKYGASLSWTNGVLYLRDQDGVPLSSEYITTNAYWGQIYGDINNQADLIEALDTKYDASNPNGYISGITDTMIIEALDYTPYDASNPNGYISGITSSDVTYALGYTPQEELVSGTNIKTINSTTLLGSGNIDVLANTATGPSSLTILGTATTTTGSTNLGVGTASTANYGTAIGHNAKAQASSATAIGRAATASGSYSAALGYGATVSGGKSIQLGYGTNSTATTLSVGFQGVDNYELLDGTTGLIPDARISNNIARASEVPTVDQAYDGTSANPQSGVAIAGTLVNYQPIITSSAMLSSDLVDDTNHTHKFATAAQLTQIATNQSDISVINGKIPSEASSSNQLADKAFVNSSIATNTAYFIGTFNSVAELEAYSGTLTNNDYAFVATTDAAGNTLYDRYKYNADTQQWIYEYELNNSSFTAAQWASINSGATTTNIGQIATNTSSISAINSTLNGFGDIVTHNVSEFATAAQGALADTALQPEDNISELTNDAGYITGITSSDVTTALGYTPYNSLNPAGYISGINSSMVTDALGYNPVSDTAMATALATKQDTLVSGTNIKTVNDVSLLGSGNIAVQPTLVSGTNIKTVNNTTLLGSGNIAVQPTLVSGTNIKTINDTTLLGSGNIAVQPTLVSGTNIKTINDISLLGSGNIDVLQNTATGIDSLTILGTASIYPYSTNIGVGSRVVQQATAIGYNANGGGYYATAIGYNASSGHYSTAIGYNARVTSNNSAIQIGYGENSTANTLNIGFYNGSSTHYNWQLLDGTTGLIPDERLSSNIQRTDTTVTHAASTAVGDSTTPVYIASDGTATALSYTIETSVPSGAVFTDTTYSDFVGADGTTAGSAGLVPAPAATDDTKFLKGDGTWGEVVTEVAWGDITGTLSNQTDLNTALNGKQATITGAATTITDSNLTASRALISNSNGKVAASSITSTKLGYLTDVTSNIQAQINGKTTMSEVEAKGYITGITGTDVTTALGYTPYNATNPSGYISSAAVSSLTDVTLNSLSGGQYLYYDSTASKWKNKTLGNSDITTALGFTPYNATNPNGYISSAALSTLTDTAISSPTNGQHLIYDSTSGKWKNETSTQVIAWGDITGTLADQTDLNTALSGKQATITGAATSITSSDLTASRALVSDSSGKVAASSITSTKLGYLTDVTSNIQAQINGKQTTLVSGTNIKTINNENILGSGNINISGGTTYTEGNGISITNDTISIDSSVVATQTDISDMATQTWVGNQGYLTSSALTNYVTTNTAQDISGRKTFLGEKAIYFKQQATTNKLGFTLYNPSNTELGALEYRPNTISGASLLALNCPQTTGGYVGFRYWGKTAVNIVAPKVATAGNYFIPTHITDGTNTVTASNTGTVNISTLLPDISTKQDTLISGINIKTINGNNLLGSGNITIEGGSGGSSTLSGLSDVTLTSLSENQNLVYDTTTGKWKNSSSNIPFYATYNRTTYSEIADAVNQGRTVILSYGYYRIPLNVITGSSWGFNYWEGEKQKSIWVNDNDSWNIGVTSYQYVSNLVTSLSSSNTNAQYPSAKCVYDNLVTKQDTLVSGTNIKTVNSTSLLGSGNVSVQPTLVSGTNIKTINNTSLLSSGNIDVLQNTATGSSSLTIVGTSQSAGHGTNVGYSTQAGEWSNAFGYNAKATGTWAEAFGGNCTASGNWSVVVGHNNEATGNYSIALGGSAYASANYAIQLGYGTNSTARSLQIGFGNSYNYTLLDGTTGLIPDARISSNIARTSQITTPTYDSTNERITW